MSLWGVQHGSSSRRVFDPSWRSSSTSDVRVRIRPSYRLQIPLDMRGEDPGVEDLCSLHSAGDLSQMGFALGPGAIDRILPKQHKAWGSPLPPAPASLA